MIIDAELYSDLDAVRRRVAGHNWTTAETQQAAKELEAALYAEQEALLGIESKPEPTAVAQ